MTGMQKTAKKIFLYLIRHKWLTITATVILIIIGLLIWRQSTRTPQYMTDKVTRATVVSEVSESGNIQTEGQANLNSPIDGVICQIYADNGDYVYTNQPLFVVRSLATDQEKAAAQAAYQAAQNNTLLAEQNKTALSAQILAAQKAIYDAQNNYNIVAKKFRHHEINPATQVSFKQLEVDSAKEAVVAAQENLASLKQKYADADFAIEATKAAEESARLNLEGKTSLMVRAPISGTVANFNNFLGDKVGPAGLSATATTPTLIIVCSQKLVFKSQINEIDIVKLKLYQDASIAIDAVKDKEFTGKIIKIDQVGMNNQGVVSYNVYTNIKDSDPGLKIGMSGNVTIESERRENVLTVANAAIKPYQDGQAVQVIDRTQKNKPVLKYIPVKVGLKGLERTEIIEGLSEGMAVVITSDINQFRSAIFGG